jgi:uncharacterized protein (TIGR04255 family)
MPLANIEINPQEVFEHLERAPITEAVVEVRTRAETRWEEALIVPRVKAALPEYPQAEGGRAIRHMLQFRLPAPPVSANSAAQTEDLGWSGIRVRSTDERNIGIFERERFSCSRLKPYEAWERFFAEAMRLWAIYREIAQPIDVQRVGLRFINQIELPPTDRFELSDYLGTAPRDPVGLILPYTNFFHHDTLAVPGHGYGVNFIQTIQPAATGRGPILVLDIDVFTAEAIPVASIAAKLVEMRWLKNKLFFGTVTPRTLEMLR